MNPSDDLMQAANGQSHSVRTSVTATTSVGVPFASPDMVVYTYSGLQGNAPAAYGNTILLWQGGPAVPSGGAPLASAPVATNMTSGSGALPARLASGASYLLAYAVGPDAQNVCATAFFEPGAAPDTMRFSLTTIAIQMATPYAILLNYAVPAGIQPAAAGHWVGVWQGYASHTVPPMSTVNVGSNTSQGSVVIPAHLAIGATYTVAYAAGPERTALAATCTFDLV